MKIFKDIQKKVEKPCFLIECEVKTDHINYFIKGIEKGLSQKTIETIKQM